MSLFDEICKIRSDIKFLGQKFGAENIRVFGSVAREEERPDSDIDFLVSMREGKSYFDLLDFQYELEELFHKKIDVLSDKGLSPYIKDIILDEARPL